MRRAALVALALGGCGRIGFEARELAADAPVDRCAAEAIDLGPFGAPTRITQATSPDPDDDPEPSDDGLELFFVSRRTGGLGSADVWVMTRAAITDAWGAPQHVAALSSPDYENTPELSADGLTMLFVSARPGGLGMDDVWISRRGSRTSSWSPPTNVAELNSPMLDRGPTLWNDETELWLHSNRMPGQQFYRATRASRTAAWSTPVRLALDGIRAWISPCGLELYFQDDLMTGTDMDFFVARRASPADAFGPAVRMDELSSGFYDQDLRLTPDRRHAYFSSRRADGVDDELYEATR